MSAPQAPDTLAVLGHTAAGKTALAVRLARALGGEILSADSRQVYRGMDIGTGKDLHEYTLDDGLAVPHHLIDILEAGQKYDLFHFVRDFGHAWQDLRRRGRLPVICGGSGLYLDAALNGYSLQAVPQDHGLRARLEPLSHEQLIRLFESMRKPHNHTDYSSRKRLVRAIEIATSEKDPPIAQAPKPRPLVLGMRLEREARRQRIAERLDRRLDQGLLQEAEKLLRQGLSTGDLVYYGLEYKFAAQHLAGQTDRAQTRDRLLVAIQQFAKRQMTWFRKMEREGTPIHWLDAERPIEENLQEALRLWELARQGRLPPPTAP